MAGLERFEGSKTKHRTAMVTRDVNTSGKIKEKLSCLCALTEHHAMKVYWGVEVQLHSFFDLGTRWR
jgi:hypothetical protein